MLADECSMTAAILQPTECFIVASTFMATRDEQLEVRNDACSVCLQTLKDARLLSCLHSFCRECIDQLSVTSDGGSVQCPLCQTTSELQENGAAGLPKDYTINHGVGCQSAGVDATYDDDVRGGERTCELCLKKASESPTSAAFWCVCQIALCKDHSTLHLVGEASEGEHMISLLTCRDDGVSAHSRKRQPNEGFSSLPLSICPEHGQPLRLHCGQCDVSICGECGSVGKHLRHEPIQYVKDVVEQRKALIAKRMMDMESNKITRLERALDAVDKVRIELKQRVGEVCTDIQQAGKRAVQAVETRVVQLLQHVDDLKKGRLKILDRQRDELKRHLDAARNAVCFSKRIFSEREGEAIFPLLHALDKRTSALMTSDIQEQPQHHPHLLFDKTSDHLLSVKAGETIGSIVPCQATAQHCKIEGCMTASEGGVVELTLWVADENGEQLTTGGNIVCPRWVGITSNSIPEIVVQDNDNGSYGITFSSAAAGNYQLQISVNGKNMSSVQTITFHELSPAKKKKRKISYD